MSRKLRSRALVAAALLWTACRTVAPPPSASLPDPFAPPAAGDPLTPSQTKAARSAWAAAGHGDSAAVARQLAKLPAGHPVRDLIALEARYVKGEAVGAAALELATRSPAYAAAWQLTSAAADREGRTEDALASARRAAELRSDEPARRSVARLEGAVVAAGVAEAGSMLARGDAAGALARARRILEIVPASDEARMLAARAALASGQTARAAELLPALPDTPEGLELKGKVAEALGQWDLALDFYTRLPEPFPGRCELVAGAREQSRMSLAPPQVSRALAEPAVTRRQLAALLIWEAPFLVEKAAGPVPVFEDVIGLPEGRDIVVAVRSGVMVGDAIARRFGPNRQVTQRELQACLERLARVAAKPAPHWCEEGAAADECLARPANLDGKTVAGLLRAVAGQEESPCSRR